MNRKRERRYSLRKRMDKSPGKSSLGFFCSCIWAGRVYAIFIRSLYPKITGLPFSQYMIDVAPNDFINWHLISPEGKHYYFHSLNFWLRENCRELFCIEPDSREFLNARSGLSGAKRAMLGGRYGCTTYKGWRVIPTEEDIKKIEK